jgi:hypothetical protein
MEISPTADAMARDIRNNRSTGHRIGDVLDTMQTEHQRAERQRIADATHQQAMERTAARYTNGIARSPEVDQPRPFDRAVARSQLIDRYPWLEPTHAENPDGMWAKAQAEHVAATMGAMRDGADPLARDKYLLAGQINKTYR